VASALLSLRDAEGEDPSAVGSKAAVLAKLAAAGFPVPPGVIVTSGPGEGGGDVPSDADLIDAVRSLGPGPFAVRSSSTAEDLAEASYAGLYETYLDVPLEDVPSAVERCFCAAGADRVRSYRERLADGPAPAPMAVLIQPMVPADAAGVAFTTNPVTGTDEAVIAAVTGLGERLVTGEAVAEQWSVARGRARRTSPGEGPVLTADQAIAVAGLAQSIRDRFAGVPQDVEWAISANELFLLQARPMTAVPEVAQWAPPGPGLWSRNFRIGEWLPDAMTPLFADWLLPALEEGFLAGMRATVGTAVPFRYASVNGWYYNAPPAPTLVGLGRALTQSRGRMLVVLFNALLRVWWNPEGSDRALLAALHEEWRVHRLPAYRRAVTAGERRVESATPAQLIDLVDDVARHAGGCLWALAIIGGSAWKMEAALVRFARRHLGAVLRDVPGGNVQVLLAGLGQAVPIVRPHAVLSLDWHQPTAGELGFSQPVQRPGTAARLAEDRIRVERACREALAGRPRLLRRFDSLLATAQKYATIREEQVADLTLGWPLLRRCALRIGAHLAAEGILAEAGDVFFLHRTELISASGVGEEIARRQRAWAGQRRLSAPLTLGAPPRLVGDVSARFAEAARRGSAQAPIVRGQPASPGRATGPVRVVAGPDDFAAFGAGDVLVARATAPAWTPLFSRAAAVVTDGGTLAAHASLVAREFGIPAVVATGSATRVLSDGELVTVDGAAGAVYRAVP